MDSFVFHQVKNPIPKRSGLVPAVSNVSNIEDAFEYIKSHQDDYIGYFKLDEVFEAEIKEALTGHKILYRCISAKDISDIDQGDLGLYWTWDRDKAQCYWGSEDESKFILKARFDDADVDWLETVEQYLKPQYAGESEIRLKKDAIVDLLDIQEL